MHKARGGLIRATAQLHRQRIADISLTGDFSVQPSSFVADVERALCGLAPVESFIRPSVERSYAAVRPQSPCVEVGDWVTVVTKLGSSETSG